LKREKHSDLNLDLIQSLKFWDSKLWEGLRIGVHGFLFGRQAAAELTFICIFLQNLLFYIFSSKCNLFLIIVPNLKEDLFGNVKCLILVFGNLIFCVQNFNCCIE